KEKIPGLSVIVAKDGKVVKRAAYGLANVELQVPATVDTVYQIASATKPFTATAIFRLIERGKLKLTDTVGNLLPEAPHTWADVTVHQLLTHASGLPDLLKTPGGTEVIAETDEAVMNKLGSLPLPAEPGHKWAYNQTNYLLLARILARVSGLSLEDFLRRE